MWGTAGGGPIDEIILLDREVDAVTPMCTQLTYEGLVDETMQIKHGAVSIDNPSGTPLAHAFTVAMFCSLAEGRQFSRGSRHL